MPVRVGVDIDDTCIITREAMCEWHNSRYGTTHHFSAYIESRLDVLWNLPEDQMILRTWEFLHEYCPYFQPVEGSAEGLSRLNERHEVVSVTARGIQLRELTLTQVERIHPGQIKEIFFCSCQVSTCEFTYTPKHLICHREKVTAMVDDDYSTAVANAEAGVPTVLLRRLWNENRPYHPGVYPVENWAEAASKVLSLTQTQVYSYAR